MDEKIEVVKELVISLHQTVQAQGALLLAACECLSTSQRQVLASKFRAVLDEQLLAQADDSPTPDAVKAELARQANVYLSRLES